MDKCPFCGAKEGRRKYYWEVAFECGTYGNAGDSLGRSDTCRELCELREWKKGALHLLRKDGKAYQGE